MTLGTLLLGQCPWPTHKGAAFLLPEKDPARARQQRRPTGSGVVQRNLGRVTSCASTPFPLLRDPSTCSDSPPWSLHGRGCAMHGLCPSLSLSLSPPLVGRGSWWGTCLPRPRPRRRCRVSGAKRGAEGERGAAYEAGTPGLTLCVLILSVSVPLPFPWGTMTGAVGAPAWPMWLRWPLGEVPPCPGPFGRKPHGVKEGPTGRATGPGAGSGRCQPAGSLP